MKILKKTFRRIISMVLAFVLLLSASVFAEPKVPYYVAIGDSITSGFGLRGNKLDQLVSDTKFLENVIHNSSEKSYPNQVAKRIYENYGLEYTNDDFANLGAMGFQVTDYEYMFGESDNEKLSNFIGRFWTHNLESFLGLVAPGTEINWDDYKWAKPIVDEIKKADIITFMLGANDLMQPLWNKMTGNDNGIIKAVSYVAKAFSLDVDLSSIDIKSVLSKLGGESSLNIKQGDLLEAIKFVNMDDFSECMLESVNAMETSYKNTVKELIKLNPNAKIVLVGMYNPFGDTRNLYGEDCFFDELYEAVKDNIFISKALFKEFAYQILHNTLGYAVSAAISRLNEIVKQTAEENNLDYVILSGPVSNEARLALHPTAVQHSDMADAIYKKIENYLQ